MSLVSGPVDPILLVFLVPQPRRLVEEQSNGLVQFGLIALDYHQIVAALIENLLGQASLSQDGIHRRHRAGQVPACKQLGHGANLILFLADDRLGEGFTTAMLAQTDQVHRPAMGLRAA